MCKRIVVLLVWITSYAVCSGSSICDAVNDGLIVGDKFGEWSCDPVHCNNCKCLSTATSNDCPFAPTENKCGSMYRGTNYLQRGYDLSEFKNPILSVSFRAYNYCEASDCISLSYSCDGGSTYTSSISYDATDITFGTVYTPSISLMGCAGKNNVYIRIKARCQDFRFNNVCIKDEIPICDAVNDGLKVGDNPGQWSCDPVHCNNCKCLSTATSNDCPFAPEINKCGSMYRGSDYLEREYDLSAFSTPLLSFSFRAYNYCEQTDCVSISYSTDGGITYTKVKSYDASDITFGTVYTPLVALPNQSQQNIRIRIKGRCQDFRFNDICVAEGALVYDYPMLGIASLTDYGGCPGYVPCHQVVGRVYKTQNGKCYEAIAICWGCLPNPDNYPTALKQIDCNPVPNSCSQIYAELTYDYDVLGVASLTNYGGCPNNVPCHQVIGRIYKTNGKCYKAIAMCWGCLPNPDNYPTALELIECNPCSGSSAKTFGLNEISGEYYSNDGTATVRLSHTALIMIAGLFLVLLIVNIGIMYRSCTKNNTKRYQVVKYADTDTEC